MIGRSFRAVGRGSTQRKRLIMANSDLGDSPSPPCATTMQVAQAIGGDLQSLNWVVARLSPVLMAQAKYRLGRALRKHLDPEDLVQEAWAAALPKLGALGKDESLTALFVVFTALCLVSTVAMALIPTTPEMRNASVDVANVKATLRMCCERKMLLLVPSIAAAGLVLGFSLAVFPAHIGRTYLGAGLIALGVCAALGSFVGGKLSDRYGQSVVFLCSLGVGSLGLVFACLSPARVVGSTQPQPLSPFYILTFCCMGAASSAVNAQVGAIVGHFYPQRSQPAFAWYRGVAALSAAGATVGGRWCTLEYFPDGLWDILLPSLVVFGCFAVAAVTLLVLHNCVASVDKDAPEGENVLLEPMVGTKVE